MQQLGFVAWDKIKTLLDRGFRKREALAARLAIILHSGLFWPRDLASRLLASIIFTQKLAKKKPTPSNLISAYAKTTSTAMKSFGNVEPRPGWLTEGTLGATRI